MCDVTVTPEASLRGREALRLDPRREEGVKASRPRTGVPAPLTSGARLGVLGVGDTIQQALEAEGLIRAAGPWWLGRPVLVTRNDYSVGRYNGDIGLVVRDDDGAWVVAFPGEGGDVRWLAPARLPEHQTVFAMTIHKSQGSEFDDVLVVLPERVSPVLTRELVYTGVTRAKRRVSVLGSEAVLRSGLSRRVQRASGLGQALAASAD